jgi:hypothetical protein
LWVERENTYKPIIGPCRKSYTQTHKRPQSSHPRRQPCYLLAVPLDCIASPSCFASTGSHNHNPFPTPPFDRAASPGLVRVLPLDSSSTRLRKSAGEAQQLRVPTKTRNLRIFRGPEQLIHPFYRPQVLSVRSCLLSLWQQYCKSFDQVFPYPVELSAALPFRAPYTHSRPSYTAALPTLCPICCPSTRYKKSPPSSRGPLNRPVSINSPLHTY